MVPAKADESATLFQPICDSHKNCCHFPNILLTKTLLTYWQVKKAGYRTTRTVWPQSVCWCTDTKPIFWKGMQQKANCGALWLAKLRVIVNCFIIAYSGFHFCPQCTYYYCINKKNTHTKLFQKHPLVSKHARPEYHEPCGKETGSQMSCDQ